MERMSSPIWKSFQGQSGIRTMSIPSFQNLLAQLNAHTLSLPERQAISYGINYPGIVAALQGAAVTPSGLVPAGLPATSPTCRTITTTRPRLTSCCTRPGTGRARSR